MKTQGMCIYVLSILVMVASSDVWAWNLGAKSVNSLQYKQNGIIEFTLWENISEDKEFICNEAEAGGLTWFRIEACDYGDAACIAASNRMASLLLGAKLAAKHVLVGHSNCVVSEVALKPN